MKKNVAVTMGGFTEEFDISLKSGQNILNILDEDRYNIFPVIISKGGWYVKQANNIKIPIDKEDFSININGGTLRFDVVFNTIHGVPGEDGTLQAYFDLMEMPYTSCGMYTSALTYNKRDLISVMRSYGINTAKNYVLDKGEVVNIDEIVSEVGLPCFVKPNRAGSSFGISKIYRENELCHAIEKAFVLDDEIIIESSLEGTEVTIGVVTYKEKIIVLPMTEIISENDFFDYDAKYLGKSQEITPARISEDIEDKLRNLAIKIYKILKMKGLSRSEFIIVDNEPHLLEVNTTPGFTKQSLLPQQIEASGINIVELFDDIIQEALKSKK